MINILSEPINNKEDNSVGKPIISNNDGNGNGNGSVIKEIKLNQELHYLNKRNSDYFIQKCNSKGLPYSELINLWLELLESFKRESNKLQVILSNNIIENYDSEIAYQVITGIYNKMNSYSYDHLRPVFNFESFINLFKIKVCTNEFLSKYDNFKVLSNKVASKLIENSSITCIKQINQFLDHHTETDKSFYLPTSEINYLLQPKQLPSITNIKFQSNNTQIRIIKAQKTPIPTKIGNNNIISYKDYHNYLLQINSLLIISKILPNVQNLTIALQSKLNNRLDFQETIEFDGLKTIYPF